MDALKWLVKYMKGHWGKTIFATLLTVVHVIAIFVTPYVTGYIVDNVIKGGRADLLAICIILLICGSLVRQLTWYIRELIMTWVGQSTVMTIRGALFEKLQKLDFDFFANNRTGDLMARMSGDMDAISNLVRHTFQNMFQQLLTFSVGIFTMYFASPVLGFSLTLLIPVIAFFVFRLSKTNKPLFIKMRESLSKLNSFVQENISGNRVVKAYTKEKFEIKRFEIYNKGYSSAFMEFAESYAKHVPIINFFIQMFSVLVILVGGSMVILGEVSLGQLTTVNGILWCITSPIQSLPPYINQYQQFVASTIKIRSLNDTQSKITDREGIQVDKLKGKITFKNVIFKFDDDEERVLKYVNFTANPGDTVAIIGPTGSGKTSLANLIPRFYDPMMGAVYIDDINVKKISIKTLRKNIAMAMQDVFLFSDSIKENIAYGTPDASMEDIIRVAKAADAHEFIEKMPEGYETIVGERGVGLSGGQKQRIALARALLQDASVLVLDDTTSALDMETEHDIQETLKRSYGGMTKFVIAHRISSVKNADLILVLNNGKVVEWGKHDDLVRKGGYYSMVCDTQFGNFNDAAPYSED
ncbi:MAG: ABC transporter ATP-binding protein, partial [Clostridia bacterium]|nr:ABC transporter ATP-binding protein [Clostridia bacterium]